MKSKAFEKFKLPFKVVYGRVGKFEMKLPWKNNFASPTVIDIEAMHLVLQLQHDSEWEYLESRSIEEKMEVINKFANSKFEDLKVALEKKENASVFDKILIKVLDNLHLNFRDLHVRVEEARAAPYFSIGITMQSLSIVNTDEYFKEKFIDRNVDKSLTMFKLLKLSNIGLYFQVRETVLLSKNLDKQQIKEAMLKSISSDSDLLQKSDYLILPINVIAKLKQNKDPLDELNPTNHLWINLQRIELEITKLKYNCLLRLLNTVSNYQQFQNSFFSTLKYNKFKPKLKSFKENYMSWFRWAISMVIKRQKFYRGNSMLLFTPQAVVEKYKSDFKNLMESSLREVEGKPETKMKANDRNYLERIVAQFDIPKLQLWSIPSIETVFKERRKEQSKSNKANVFANFFSSLPKKDAQEIPSISKEEEQKIIEMIEKIEKEVDPELCHSSLQPQLRIDIKLNAGSFKFSTDYQSNETRWTEGFQFYYSNLIISTTKGGPSPETNSFLSEFNIEMFTEVNSNLTITKITFLDNQLFTGSNVSGYKSVSEQEFANQDWNPCSEIDLAGDHCIWNIKVRRPANQPQSSFIEGSIKSLNFVYNQLFIQRLLDFFVSTQLNDEAKGIAFEQWLNLKESTQESLKKALQGSNSISLVIDPRVIIIPINKYNIINSKILVFELGSIMISTSKGNELYPTNYLLNVLSSKLACYTSFQDFILLKKTRLELFSDISIKMSMSALNSSISDIQNISHTHPRILMKVEIESLEINLTDYLYSLLENIIDIFKPMKDSDMWSTLSNSTEEIKKNSKWSGMLLKKDGIYKSWTEYFCVLSAGYIYFYNTVDSADASGFFYLKDINVVHSDYTKENAHGLLLKSKFGQVELKFYEKENFDLWVICLNQRVEEIKITSDERLKRVDQEIEEKGKALLEHGDLAEYYFGVEVSIVKVEAVFRESVQYKNSKIESQPEDTIIDIKLLTIQLKEFNFNMKMRELDNGISLGLKELNIIDNITQDSAFRFMLTSVNQLSKSNSNCDNDANFVSVSVGVYDETSPFFNNNRIEVGIKVKYTCIIWNPLMIKKFMALIVHNDVMRSKVKCEIDRTTQNLLDNNFLESGEVQKAILLKCKDTNSNFLVLNCHVKEVMIIWVQPVLNFMLTEVIASNLKMDLTMTVDHLYFSGSLDDTQVSDLSNYPYTIESQSEFNPENKKTILSFKSCENELKSLPSILFNLKKHNEWCPECPSEHSSECFVELNSPILIYYQENFIRFFDYLLDEFLGSLPADKETEDFIRLNLQIKPKSITLMELMQIKMKINSPKLVLKPRPSSHEFFVATLECVNVESVYKQAQGKVYQSPQELRWQSSYILTLEQTKIVAHDGFTILSPIDSQFIIHSTRFSHEDLCLGDLKIDNGVQFDYMINKLKIKLRQIDFTNIIKCSDLNIVYNDMMQSYYDFNPFKSAEGKVLSEKDDLAIGQLKSIKSSITFIMAIQKIEIMLYVGNRPFCEICLYDSELDFFKRLSLVKECYMSINKLEVYSIYDNANTAFETKEDQPGKTYFASPNDMRNEINMILEYSETASKAEQQDSSYLKYQIVSDFKVKKEHKDSNNDNKVSNIIKDKKFDGTVLSPTANKSSSSHIEMRVIIHESNEKQYFVTANNLKTICKLDCISLIGQFFKEGLPFYDYTSIDLPNFYDSNENNCPGYKLCFELKNPLIALLTDNVSSTNQMTVCLSSDFMLIYKKERIQSIKDKIESSQFEILQLKSAIDVLDKETVKSLDDHLTNQSRFPINSLTLTFSEFSPFICGKEVLFSQMDLPKRKLIDPFDFQIEQNDFLERDSNNGNYSLFKESTINLKNIILKLSYKDFVVVMKAWYYIMKSLDDEYLTNMEELVSNTKVKSVCEQKYKNQNFSPVEIDKSMRSSIKDSVHSEKSLSCNIALKRASNHKEAKIILEFCDDDINASIINNSSYKGNLDSNKLMMESIINPELKSMNTFIDRGASLFLIQGSKLNLVLIDDKADTYYPFLLVEFTNIRVAKESTSFTSNTVLSSMNISSLIYNYMAGAWEPLIESTYITINVTNDSTNPLQKLTFYELAVPRQSTPETESSGFTVLNEKSDNILNMNISDITIIFLYKTMLTWKEKYENYVNLLENPGQALKLDEPIENQLIISNHTILNFSGCVVAVYKVFKKDKYTFDNSRVHLCNLGENLLYNIEYFDDYSDVSKASIIKENYVLFLIHDQRTSRPLSQAVIKVDCIQIVIHKFDKEAEIQELGLHPEVKKFQYVITEVKFDFLKKNIYFYSPLNIQNNSSLIVNICLVRKGLSRLWYFLEPNQIIGIPFEYFDGMIEIGINECNDPLTTSILPLLLNVSPIEQMICLGNRYLCIASEKKSKPYRILTLTHPYTFRNCLPFDVSLSFSHVNDRLKVIKGTKIYVDIVSKKENLVMGLSFLDFVSKGMIMVYDKAKPSEISKITVLDSNKNETEIYISLIDPVYRVFVIYCPGLIINETLMSIKFFYYTKNKKKVEVAGQSEPNNVLPIMEEKKIVLICEGLESQAYSINGIGVSTIVECRSKDKVYEFIMTTKVSLIAEDLNIFSEIITFSPRYILFNELPVPVYVSVVNCPNNIEQLQPFEKKPFYFFGKKSTSDIFLRINSYKEFGIESEEENQLIKKDSRVRNWEEDLIYTRWIPSKTFNFDCETLLTLMFKLQDPVVSTNECGPQNRVYFNIEKKVKDNSTIVVFSKANLSNCSCVIENESKMYSLRIWQDESPSEFLDSKSKRMFDFDPKKEIIYIEYMIGHMNSTPLILPNSTVKFKLESSSVIVSRSKGKRQQNHIQQVESQIQIHYPAVYMMKLQSGINSGFSVKTTIKTDGIKKRIIISDCIYDFSNLRDKRNELHLYKASLSINRMGISLIGDNRNLEKVDDNQKYVRKELVYITLDNLIFFSYKEVSPKLTVNQIQVCLKDMQIDNQMTLITHYPVILRPINTLQSVNETSSNAVPTYPPFLNIAITLETTPEDSVTNISLFNYLLQSAYINMDTEIVENFINFVLNILSDLKTNINDVHPAFLDLETNLKRNIFMKDGYLSPEWVMSELPNEKSKYFIQLLEMSSIEIILSFYSNSKYKIFSRFTSNPFISGIMSTLTNIDCATFRLNGSTVHNIYGSGSKIFNQVLNIYKQYFLVQAMRLFGAIDILGNPINLMASLGTGVKDFFSEPAKGIQKGPLQGIVGVFGGSVSLMKHTMGGTMGAASKITSGISKGMLFITRDTNYANNREIAKITEKPKNIAQGLGYGAKSMAKGIFYGVTDVFTKPIEGAKTGEIKEFGKGLIKGLAGVAIKPISGVFDMFSKTTEGIKNSFQQEKVFEKERIPRPFYGRFKSILDFNFFHAQVIEMMNGKLQYISKDNFKFYSADIFKNDKEITFLLVFSTLSIIFIDLSVNQFKHEINYYNINSAILETDYLIRIMIKPTKNQKQPNCSISFSFKADKGAPKRILGKINEALENNFEEYTSFNYPTN